MNYARWMDLEEFKNKLIPLNKESEIVKSGVPMMYDDKYLYTETSERHNLIIGSTGSGKTQSTLLPQLRLAIKTGESIVVNDVRGELYSCLKDELERQNYTVITINFTNPTIGNNYNPLSLAQKLYKDYKDKCVDILENIGYYFFSRNNGNADPFWENSASNFFTGLALYLFEKKENVSLKDVLELSMNLDKENILEKIDNNSIAYMYLSGTLNAPKETKGSIISVFHQKLNLYVCRENLSSLLSISDFNLEEITEGNFALFIINDSRPYIQNLVSLLVQQVYEAIEYSSKRNKRINIILDEFEILYPIKNFVTMLTTSRYMNVRFTLTLRSLLELKNNYGVENSELIKLNVGNIIYLLANDIETLDEISKMCGMKMENNKLLPLITSEELKLMDNFEAIILIPRLLPIRTKLLPDYKINW
ncbi:MAG: type IV secretory system conjugative DNA transfer family protein [bacterium]|nr:type IV secretory system conjugative DNA transfer family protein [bacterium]